MIRTALLILASSSFLRVCGRNPQPPQVAPVGSPSGVAAMMPEHGGQVAVSGGLVTEVNAQPDGRLVAYVRDGQGQPVVAQQVQLSVRRPDGHLIPVGAVYDAQLGGYVARPAGVAPGQYPIEVGVVVTPGTPPVQLLTPPVAIATRIAAPSPRHGGRVEIVGNHAVETVVARNGDVAMFWMDMNGVPIPPAQVTVPSVTVTAGARIETVPVRVVGDRFVGHIVMPPSPDLVIGVPTVVVQGVAYERVVYPRPVIVASLPSVMVMAPPPPAVVVGVPAPPTVVVGVPAPPTVVVGGMAPGVVVAGNVPQGRAVGYWRNHGGVVVAPPSVVVAAPPPPVFGGGVVVGGGVAVGGGGGWGGGGGGWGHGEGHGGGGGGWGGGGGHGHGRH